MMKNIDITVQNRQKVIRVGRRERDVIRMAAEAACRQADTARIPTGASRRQTGAARKQADETRVSTGASHMQTGAARMQTDETRVTVAQNRRRLSMVVILTDDGAIREANKSFRGANKATDVLSFPSDDYNEFMPGCNILKTGRNAGADSPPAQNQKPLYAGRAPKPDGKHAAGIFIGEVMISAERAFAQAEEYGHGIERELGFLTAHGALHLMGYDHETAGGEAEMRRLTEHALEEIGLPRRAAQTEGEHIPLKGAPEGFRSGFIAVLGKPNVGKSTLINMLCGNSLSIVSNKPQTTRRNARMILTTKSYQLVLVDTPGIHAPKNRLGVQMVRRARGSVKDADAIFMVIDARESYLNAENKETLSIAKSSGTPVALIINKVDLVAKETLLPLIARFSSQHDFACIIPVSATKASERDIILKEAVKLIPQGGLLYPEDMITDQASRRLAEDIIRGNALKLLEQEIPHGIDVEVDRFHLRGRDGLYEINATIYCEREAHKKIIIGKNGGVLKKIGALARVEIERLQDAQIFLGLWVKVRKDWRDNDVMLRRMGYFDA